MLKIHTNNSGFSVAEIIPGAELIGTAQSMLDLMAEAGYEGHSRLIISKENLHPDFFDLRTGLAGSILQKFSNYRMQLTIYGDFSNIQSKSLNDFIRESNRTGHVKFVANISMALL